MRVVASHATYPRIAAVSAAIEDSIRLIAQVIHSTLLWHQQRLFKTDVTRTADFLRQFVAIQLCRIENLGVLIAGFDRRDVFFAGTMTTFTSNAGRQMIELQLRCANRRG